MPAPEGTRLKTVSAACIERFLALRRRAVRLLVLAQLAPPSTPRQSTPPIDEGQGLALRQAEGRQLGEDARASDAALGQDATAGSGAGRPRSAIYALLAAGESPQDQRLAKAIEYLKKADLERLYALGLRCQVWLLLPQTPELKAAHARRTRSSLASIRSRPTATASGFYDYNPTAPAAATATAARSTACSGMWAAAQAGVEVPDRRTGSRREGVDRAPGPPAAGGRTQPEQTRRTRSRPA